MPNHARRSRRAAVAAVCLFVVASAFRPRGQALDADHQWQPWLGCWSPTASLVGEAGGPPQLVCVVPAPGTSAVDVITLSGERELSREHVEADGQRHMTERDGCRGWELAEWSSNARRVYLRSESTCAGGLIRQTSGLITMSSDGGWHHIIGVKVREEMGVRVLRHHARTAPLTLPPAITDRLAASSRSSAAGVADAPIGDADVIDASHHVDPGVVEAWLADSRQAYTINAKRLVALADAGVDGRVTDVLVALSNPKAFAIRPSPSAIGALARPEVRRGGGSASGLALTAVCGPYDAGFSVYGWDGCSPFGSLTYGRQYGYPYDGQSGFGDRFGYYGSYYGAYYADTPSVVVVSPEPPATHGRVVNGSGYSSGDNDSGRSSSGGDSVSSGSTSSGGGSIDSSGGDRTAVPR